MLLKRLFSRRRQPLTRKEGVILKEEAAALSAEGKVREAVEKFRAYLATAPHDVDALNDYGVALATIGLRKEAAEALQAAIALDDSHLASLINFANVLKDGANTSEALRHVIAARIQVPSTPGVNGCYSSILFSRGDANGATCQALESWLGGFTLRPANQFLFTATYAAVDEEKLAAEHKFWAETLPPLGIDVGERNSTSSKINPGKGPRLRIGYWSPDLREHSVRFFFRPMLEGHDKNSVETFVFHDSHSNDAQTAAIEQAANHFFDVSEWTDEKLAKHIADCDLDVLVELAGHTSTNRIDLLRLRLARLQITGLGYPPTTGLSSIDCKLSDIYIAHSDAAKYYTEELAVLPQSFWCFDPKEEIPLRPEIASDLKGHVTFACFGNIAKINDVTLTAWAAIIDALPSSRLAIKATNFVDPAVRELFAARLEKCGIPLQRVDLQLPEGSRNFFLAYEEVDLILDTFPFNGGTTSCFAAYMGIPIVTMTGRSTASRMGLSVMSNLGAPDFAVDNWTDYINVAIRLGKDVSRRRTFKTTARQKFQSTALGNGTIFTSHFVDFCRNWLAGKQPKALSRVRDLDAEELTRRARILFRRGNFDAAHRVVDYCLRVYPDHGDAHILRTEKMARSQNFSEAASYLRVQAQALQGQSLYRAQLQQARYELLAADTSRAAATISNLNDAAKSPNIALRLLNTALACSMKNERVDYRAAEIERSFHFIIPTDSEGGLDQIRQEIYKLAREADVGVSVERCSNRDKSEQYRNALKHDAADVIVLLQPNISILSAEFFPRVAHALKRFDAVSYLGADGWNNMDWRDHAGQRRFGSVVVPAGDRANGFELQVVGDVGPEFLYDAQVLEGALMALDAKRCAGFLSDECLLQELHDADTLCEDYFAYAIGRNGARLGVHAALPILSDWRISLPAAYIGPARQAIYDRLHFDPLAFEVYDAPVSPVPVATEVEACQIQTSFFSLDL